MAGFVASAYDQLTIGEVEGTGVAAHVVRALGAIWNEYIVEFVDVEGAAVVLDTHVLAEVQADAADRMSSFLRGLQP